jgi:hypothetical protein
VDGRPVQERAHRTHRPRGQVLLPRSSYDFDVKAYIDKFNGEHKGKINLLDFSNYSTKFNDFKEGAISRKDMEVIREFQKRKIDQRLHTLNK